MRQLVALCLFAVVFVATAQTIAFPNGILEADRRCALASDCVLIGNDCCSSNTCNYLTVNTTVSTSYQEKYRAFLSSSCTTVDCAAANNGAVCSLPVPVCAIPSGARTGLCTLGGAGTATPTARQITCAVSSSPAPTCETTCSASTSSTQANTCTSTDPVVACKNECKASLGTCTNTPNAITLCGFVYRNTTEAELCVRKCNALTPTVQPPKPICGFITGAEKCDTQCIDTQGRLYNQPACTPSTEAACRNKCYDQTRCNATLTGCRAVPIDSTFGLERCLLACAPVITSTTPTTCNAYGSGAGCETICSSATPSPNVANCVATDPAIVCSNKCKAELASCSAAQNTATGCAFVPRNLTQYSQCQKACQPAVPTAPVSCKVANSGSNCESVCVDSRFASAECLATDPLTVCVNGCKRELATCGAASAGTTNGGCGFVPKNQTTYFQCVDRCRITAATPTTTVPRTCSTVTLPERCTTACVDTTGRAIAQPTCTPSTAAECFNKCQTLGKCQDTSNGCGLIPNNATEYRSCLAACDTPLAPTTAPKQCMRTGCSGEICSSVPVVSTCQFTCKTACYRQAECAANADGGCGFVLSESLNTCLKTCEGVTPAVKPPTDQCKITGCQREFCISSAFPDPDCSNALPEPTCENKCLQYATCSASIFSLDGSATSPNTAKCGWTPNPNTPNAYGECLRQCRPITEDRCFVSGCGSVCSNVASLQPCDQALVAPDCRTKCKMAYSACNMTNTGCNFLPVSGIERCLAECDAVTPAVKPPTEPVCPNGVPVANCLVDPCRTASCPAFPNAQCKADYCGGCRAVFYNADNRVVNCDPCGGKTCDTCRQDARCGFCSGTYSDGNTNKTVGFCVASTGSNAERCIAASNRLLTGDSSTCPSTGVTGGDNGIRTEVSDATNIQNEVAAQNSVSSKFIIVITLVVNQTTSDEKGFNLVQMFVDLIGSDTPNQTDRDQVCSILKNSLVKVDARIPADKLTCQLNEKNSVKRDASFIADLAYPGQQQADSASGLVFSLGAVLLAVFATLF